MKAIELLSATTSNRLHEFWPADISLLDPAKIDGSKVHGPGQLTDLYLLSLAVSRGGKLATFDGAIPRQAVPGAEARHLVVV